MYNDQTQESVICNKKKNNNKYINKGILVIKFQK